METAKLKKFAQSAKRSLMGQVSAKLKFCMAENSAARCESAEAVKELEASTKCHSKEQVVERIAYIWFNRFCALRFMDVNRYTRIGVVSPIEGQVQRSGNNYSDTGGNPSTLSRSAEMSRHWCENLVSGDALKIRIASNNGFLHNGSGKLNIYVKHWTKRKPKTTLRAGGDSGRVFHCQTGGGVWVPGE